MHHCVWVTFPYWFFFGRTTFALTTHATLRGDNRYSENILSVFSNAEFRMQKYSRADDMIKKRNSGLGNAPTKCA